MSTTTHPARLDDLPRLWPAVKALRTMADFGAFERFWAEGPWRVRLSSAGEALLLEQWRADLDVLAIKALWAPQSRTQSLVVDARSVAQAQGFGRVVSPLIPEEDADPYLGAGLAVHERIVALQVSAGDRGDSSRVAEGAVLRLGSTADIEALLAIDDESFDPFWRYGAHEFASAMRDERLMLAVVGGDIAGYSTVSSHGSSATLGRLAVGKAHRRRGIASLLVADAGRWAASSGHLALTLCTQEDNSASRALYGRLGFSEMPERYVLALGDV